MCSISSTNYKLNAYTIWTYIDASPFPIKIKALVLPMKSNILVIKFSILKRLIINSDLTLILNESPIVCQNLNFGV